MRASIVEHLLHGSKLPLRTSSAPVPSVRALSIARDPLKPDGLFFLQALVVHAEQTAIRRESWKTDIVGENMGPKVRRQLREISVRLESFPEMAAGDFVDDPGAVDVATQVEITRIGGDHDSPLHGARLRLGQHELGGLEQARRLRAVPVARWRQSQGD